MGGRLNGQTKKNYAADYIMFVQSLNNFFSFFSSSTSRWAITLNCLKSHSAADKLKLNLKSLSVTRWSARHDACKALVVGYKEIQNALTELSIEHRQRLSTRHEAFCLVKKLSKRKTALLTVVNNSPTFRSFYKSLQKVESDLDTVAKIYFSLEE